MKVIIQFFMTIFFLSNIALPTGSPFSYEIYNSLVPTTKQDVHFITAHDRIKLAYYAFPAAQSQERAVVIMYHGGGAYSTPAYQWVAEKLQQQGVSTYCFDVRGHGNSEGPRGDAPSVDTVFDDVKLTIEWVKAQHHDAPLYLVGHSSGAGLLINYHNAYKDLRVDGYILLAPFLGPNAASSRYEGAHQNSFVKNVRVWVFILNALLPVEWFHHVNAVYFNYPDDMIKANPLYVSKYTYVMSTATTPYAINDILTSWGNMPFWVFVGENDEQFYADRVVTLCQAATQQPTDARIIPDAQHLSILKNAPDLILESIHKQFAEKSQPG